MCCTPLAENAVTQKIAKIRHLRTIAQLCQAASLQLRYVPIIGKNCWIAIPFPHASQYGELQLTNGWDRYLSLGHPSKFQRVFASWLRYCSDVAHRRPTKHCTMFGRLLGWYTIYSFSGATEFCRVQNSLCVHVLPSLILAVLLHGTPAAVASQTLRYGTRNGITELSQRAPPIFGWAAITLGISPHTSYFWFFSLFSTCGFVR